MRYVIVVLSLCASVVAGAVLLLCTLAVATAAVTLTESEEVTLLRSGKSVGTYAGWEACKARARELAREDTRSSGKVTYVCQTERYRIVAAYAPAEPEPSCTEPQPGSESRRQSCPAGTLGSWTQTRIFVQAAYPACWLPGEWAPSSQPPDTCAVSPPSDDTVEHGAPIAITGAGFGSKSQAAPLVFDDFETGSGNVGGSAAAVGRWNASDYCTGVIYDTHQGERVARHVFGGGRYNASLCVDPPATRTVYLDFWAKGAPRANPSRNWKVWRFYDASDNDVGNLVYYCRGGGVQLGNWKWLAETPPPTGWVHYEVIQTPGGSRHYRNGKLDSSSSNAPPVTQVRVGHYWGTDAAADCASNPGGDVYTDDVYVDTSVARVVLADASTFDAATRRAIQVSGTWSDTRVEIERANTKRFTPGDVAYLLVMDAANVQRASKRVTVR